VTIIAGFKTKEGVVICADTQETISNISKRNVPKLRFEPADKLFYGARGHRSDDVAAAFCGAANNGPFIDKLVDNAWESAQACASLDEVCVEVEASIKATYKEFSTIYQSGYCPEAELIYGVKMSGSTKLFSALGPVVTERTEYASGGAGYYMADFLKAKMYGNHLTLHQCVILAAYTLFQAKEHVDGCGGESHIAVLRDNGVSGRVAADKVDAITKLLVSTDDAISRVLLDAANLEHTDETFRQELRTTLEVVARLRNIRKGELDRARETLEAVGRILGGLSYQPETLDPFGLPMPSGAQTSESEQ